MKRFVLSIALASAAVLGACASPPKTAAAPAALPTQCAQLQDGIHATEKAKRIAQEKQRNAWKAVVPFVVAAHHARARSEVAETDKRLAELKAEATRRGCAGARA